MKNCISKWRILYCLNKSMIFANILRHSLVNHHLATDDDSPKSVLKYLAKIILLFKQYSIFHQEIQFFICLSSVLAMTLKALFLHVFDKNHLLSLEYTNSAWYSCMVQYNLNVNWSSGQPRGLRATHEDLRASPIWGSDPSLRASHRGPKVSHRGPRASWRGWRASTGGLWDLRVSQRAAIVGLNRPMNGGTEKQALFFAILKEFVPY